MRPGAIRAAITFPVSKETELRTALEECADLLEELGYQDEVERARAALAPVQNEAIGMSGTRLYAPLAVCVACGRSHGNSNLPCSEMTAA